MLRALLSVYRLSFPRTIVYMLQATEYQPAAYLKWLWRVGDFSKVTYRKTLVDTKPARLLLLVMVLGMLAQIFFSVWLFWWALDTGQNYLPQAAIGLLLAAPIIWAHLIVLPLLLGRWFISAPSQALQIRKSRLGFKNHRATKIAIAGSYGKTTMKEMLLVVLSEGKKVAATPANKNVAISHAQFAKALEGDEEILLIEYGEGAPGDVTKFIKNTHPDMGIITGLAPAHLDRYKTLEAAGKDIFSLAEYLEDKNVFVNQESEAAKPFLKKPYRLYGADGALGWKVQNIKVSLKGLSFTMQKGKEEMHLKSQLLGRHQVGPLALVAALTHQLGLSSEQVERGISKIESFEHRMQPYPLAGAWIIDDTYNGNIEGMKAGLELLGELSAKRKIYITPGLVDQGAQSPKIHRELGEMIAKARPDLIILMKHSVTNDIVAGIEENGFKSKLQIEEDPLHFYNNLEHFVAAGDLVLMQNDWPDQYN